MACLNPVLVRIVPDSWMSSTYYTRWMTLLRLDSGQLILLIIGLIIINLLQALTKAPKTLTKKLSTESVSDAAELSTLMVRIEKLFERK